MLASKITQSERELAAKPSNLSLIPATHTVEEENQFSQVVICPIHI